MKNRIGQVATFLTLGLVVLGAVIALGSSFFVNKINIAMNSRAAGLSCIPTTCPDGETVIFKKGSTLYSDKDCSNAPSYNVLCPPQPTSKPILTTAPAPTQASSGGGGANNSTCHDSRSLYSCQSSYGANWTYSSSSQKCCPPSSTTGPVVSGNQNSGDVDAQGNPLPNGEINHCCFLFAANSRCNGGPTLIYWGDGMRCIASSGLGKVTSAGHCSDLGGSNLSVGDFQCQDASGNPNPNASGNPNANDPSYNPNLCQSKGYTNDLPDNVFACCNSNGFVECLASPCSSNNNGLQACAGRGQPTPTPSTSDDSTLGRKCIYGYVGRGSLLGYSCNDSTLSCDTTQTPPTCVRAASSPTPLPAITAGVTPPSTTDTPIPTLTAQPTPTLIVSQFCVMGNCASGLQYGYKCDKLITSANSTSCDNYSYFYLNANGENDCKVAINKLPSAFCNDRLFSSENIYPVRSIQVFYTFEINKDFKILSQCPQIFFVVSDSTNTNNINSVDIRNQRNGSLDMSVRGNAVNWSIQYRDPNATDCSVLNFKVLQSGSNVLINNNTVNINASF